MHSPTTLALLDASSGEVRTRPAPSPIDSADPDPADVDDGNSRARLRCVDALALSMEHGAAGF